MPYKHSLPKDKKQREEVVSRMITQGRSLRNPQQIRWWLANLYLQGLREFSHVNYADGTVSVAYLNEAGILKFRYDEIVAKYQSQLGRLYSLDISPAVKRKGVSLDGMRKASVAQVVLDAALPEEKTRQFKLDIMPALLRYGTVGVGLWYEGDDSQGLELIPPWQLFPIPVNIAGPSEVRGLMRVRPVPLDWIKSLSITPGSGSAKYNGLEDVKVESGHLPIDMDTQGEGLVSMSAAGGGFFIRAEDKDSGKMYSGRKKKKDETVIPITQLVELWLETSDGYLADYNIYAGMEKLTELYHVDHSQHKYPMPIRIIRDVTVGSFWGRSYIDQMIPLNNEMEYALSSIFQSISDFDLYGLQLWPTTMGTPSDASRGQDGIKRLQYEPDYTCPDMKPEHIQPSKMVAPQIQALQLAGALMDKIANQPQEMMSGGAPGRVDSSAGLGFLYEVSGIPLSPTAKNIAEGMAGIYRSMLRILKDRWSDQKVVGISNLDDTLAGIVIDAKTGDMKLSRNAIPHPAEVNVTVASEVPVSREQQKAELKEALKDQRMTLDEFNFEVRKRGLDIPVGGEKEWQNYRRAMLENIMLFGDGESPGQVIVSDRDDHRIHLMVIDAFMARPEFYAASDAVRKAFVKHRDEHYYGMGNFPEPMPMPEEGAAAMMGQMPGGMPPGGMM